VIGQSTSEPGGGSLESSGVLNDSVAIQMSKGGSPQGDAAPSAMVHVEALPVAPPVSAANSVAACVTPIGPAVARAAHINIAMTTRSAGEADRFMRHQGATFEPLVSAQPENSRRIAALVEAPEPCLQPFPYENRSLTSGGPIAQWPIEMEGI
jgi:hypothetical protein